MNNKIITRALILGLILTLIVIQAEALDYPHNEINNIGCDSCHFVYGDEPSYLPEWTDHVAQDIDDTQYNVLCWSCHNDIKAPYMMTHSSLQIDNGYGDWSVDCKTCHSPHMQKQLSKYRSESYVISGVSTGLTTTTLTQDGAGWTVDAYQGMVLVPYVTKTTKRKYGYKILSNTDDTITVEGPINLAKVSVGKTFAVIFGKELVSSVILDNIIGVSKTGTKVMRLFRATGTNSYADGSSPYEGICEVCHTLTDNHRNNATGNHNHMAKSNCITCHTHETGFKGKGCDTCHGYPPTVDIATGGPDGLVDTPGVTGATTAGAHDKHVTTKSYACGFCHYDFDGSLQSHNNGAPQDITIGFSLFDGAYLGGIYDGESGVNYDSNEANTTVINTGTNTCSNIYCHGELPNGTVWGGGDDTTIEWTGSVTCTSCHDDGGSLSNLSYKHSDHTDATTYAFTCEKCHNQTANGSTSIKNESYHANNVKDVIFAPSGTYNSGTKACSNNCHSDAAGGAPNVAVAWSDSTTMECDSCHDGRTTVDDTEMSTNGHERLVNSSWVRKYKCYYCHDDTVDTSSNIKNYTKHVDGTKDVVMDENWNIAGEPDASYNSGTKVCSNVYCHSDGTTSNPVMHDVAWTDGRMLCNSCHGHLDGTCVNCHAEDGYTGWAAGEEWKAANPMYTNGGAGAVKANTHWRHALTEFSCANCHANTIANGNCASCHVDDTPAGDMGEVEHINTTYHVNKVKDLAFSAGGTYNAVDKTCSSTFCHSGSDPQWGDSVDSNVICLDCHGTTGSDVNDFTPSNDTRAKFNTTEWTTSGHGRTTGNYAESDNPPANLPGNPCVYCHDNDVLHNDLTNPFRLNQHDQFSNRFDKECVYCHLEGLDTECFNCHNDSGSMAPQLADIVVDPDHTGYTDELTSCVASCHATDADQHNTSSDTWTSEQKDDVKNQYIMMGVCLVCHDDDSNGKCTSCHTGEQYELGFDPGSGLVSGTSKATSTHFGYKHYAAYELDGTWKGGKFCWDCHDPHGDSNIYMIQDDVAIETDGIFGMPVATREVVFTRALSGTDYAKSSPPYNGICNVCHEQEDQHYQFDYGDGHQSTRVCTTCHEHRFTDSHASGQACNICHANKPIARHEAFGQPRDCTKCHDGLINKRVDILGQFRANSHHVQGVEVTNKHCYACHWEATSVGTINTDYHSGYNYKTYESTADAPANLVIWEAGARPTTYEDGVTAVTFQAIKVGTEDERTEVAKITQMCLGCHSDQNNDTQPFKVVDPASEECKTPRQYAWDRMSIAARYSQTGTTTWGKYSGTANAAQKNITKAFSAHGNAVNNQGGWSVTEGYDGTTPDTRAGTENVQCFDCHNSHGSKAVGITSSYMTFNGGYNGANLKETQAGKGGYVKNYKGIAGGGAVNPYNVGAAQCFDCHENANAKTLTSSGKYSPWGYNETYGATEPIMGYKDNLKFGTGTKGSTTRYSYRASKVAIGGHLNASSDLVGLDGTPGTGDEAMGTIGGLCTPCHDPHGVSPRLGANQAYAVPLLKGTWMTSPYKEDAPNPKASGTGGANVPGWKTDRNTFGGGSITEDETQFAGLCLRCHPKDNLTDGTNKNTAFKSLDRSHETVKGWGNNVEHRYTCSKCHQAHNSGLPRLLQTNCLDISHRGRQVSGGAPNSHTKCNGNWVGHPKGGGSSGAHNTIKCHVKEFGTSNERWNNISPW